VEQVGPQCAEYWNVVGDVGVACHNGGIYKLVSTLAYGFHSFSHATLVAEQKVAYSPKRLCMHAAVAAGCCQQLRQHWSEWTGTRAGHRWQCIPCRACFLAVCCAHTLASSKHVCGCVLAIIAYVNKFLHSLWRVNQQTQFVMMVPAASRVAGMALLNHCVCAGNSVCCTHCTQYSALVG
jgi:hypothetical protein